MTRPKIGIFADCTDLSMPVLDLAVEAEPVQEPLRTAEPVELALPPRHFRQVRQRVDQRESEIPASAGGSYRAGAHMKQLPATGGIPAAPMPPVSRNS